MKIKAVSISFEGDAKTCKAVLDAFSNFITTSGFMPASAVPPVPTVKEIDEAETYDSQHTEK